MSETRYTPLGSLRSASDFRAHVEKLGLEMPVDADATGADSASILARPLSLGEKRIGNRLAIHPMEGWDGERDGSPSEMTVNRWRNFGLSGAKLIWGGEAVAVNHEGRANPNQLLINDKTKGGLAKLRETLISAHREIGYAADDLLIGLQLTHSGRYSRPNEKAKPEPRILYHHPVLDRRVNVDENHRPLTDAEVAQIVDDFRRAAITARELGFDFVDIKHCHGYLGHEFLSAHTRPGPYGGSFENRTRFLRETVEGVRRDAPGLDVGVRLSAFDVIPFQPNATNNVGGKTGVGVPAPYRDLLPYRYGFGVDAEHPERYDLTETKLFLALLRDLGIRLVNTTAGSPYYNPHVQRPALYPPSDGYSPPEDPLVGVARQMGVTRELKSAFPDLIFVGTGYTYLQEFLPHVASAAVRENWVDSIGLGRMVLSYPDIARDMAEGRALRKKAVCRTFSDCTTAPRNGLPSGCYPLDPFYKQMPAAEQLKKVKADARRAKETASG